MLKFYLLIFVLLWQFEIPREIPNMFFINVNGTVSNINFGGCGYFAYYLHSHLDSNRYKIASISGIRHITIYDSQRNLYIDSWGYHSSFWTECVHFTNNIKIISRNTLHTWLKTKQWNTVFNAKDTLLLRTCIENWYIKPNFNHE